MHNGGNAQPWLSPWGDRTGLGRELYADLWLGFTAAELERHLRQAGRRAEALSRIPGGACFIQPGEEKEP
ncbi:MAG: hypothetical protein NT090_20650 [Acidobacteria bacterium]|nr:hypothetical protein [Acidobacteriota bacterium]